MSGGLPGGARSVSPRLPRLLLLLAVFDRARGETLSGLLSAKFGAGGSCGGPTKGCTTGVGCGYGTEACTCAGSVYLYDRGLSGTLPSELGACTGLEYLYLGHNALSGTLPSEWGSLTSLWYLHLTNNKLSGTLPASWSSLSALEVLYVRDNRLEGAKPGWAEAVPRTDIGRPPSNNSTASLSATSARASCAEPPKVGGLRLSAATAAAALCAMAVLGCGVRWMCCNGDGPSFSATEMMAKQRETWDQADAIRRSDAAAVTSSSAQAAQWELNPAARAASPDASVRV